MDRAIWIHRLALLPLLGLLLYITWYVYNYDQEGGVVERLDPLLEAEEFILIRYNEAGEQLYYLEGHSMVHYEGERGTEITHPDLIYYDHTQLATLADGEAPNIIWSATGKRALLSEDNSEITLIDDVHLTRFDQEQALHSTLDTSILYVLDHGEEINTDAPVVIHSDKHTLTGVGMVGKPTIGLYHVLKDAKTIYVQ